MPTWLKFRITERKQVHIFKDDEIIAIPTKGMVWISYPSMIDLETIRIRCIQALMIDDEYNNMDATLITYTDGSTAIADYKYDDFVGKIILKYNKLIEKLEFKLALVDNVINELEEKEISKLSGNEPS